MTVSITVKAFDISDNQHNSKNTELSINDIQYNSKNTKLSKKDIQHESILKMKWLNAKSASDIGRVNQP